jgi:hypothetical protein
MHTVSSHCSLGCLIVGVPKQILQLLCCRPVQSCPGPPPLLQEQQHSGNMYICTESSHCSMSCLIVGVPRCTSHTCCAAGRYSRCLG